MPKRVLVVVETNQYEMPMLDHEDRRTALQRYLDTGPDSFYRQTNERDSWVEDEHGKVIPEEGHAVGEEVTP